MNLEIEKMSKEKRSLSVIWNCFFSYCPGMLLGPKMGGVTSSEKSRKDERFACKFCKDLSKVSFTEAKLFQKLCQKLQFQVYGKRK